MQLQLDSGIPLDILVFLYKKKRQCSALVSATEKKTRSIRKSIQNQSKTRIVKDI